MADPNAKTGSKVSVGCKLPHGLVIQPERMVEEKGADGAVMRKYLPHGPEVTLTGANTSNVIGGYGITENVDKDVWDAWLEKHRSYAPVVQGLVFAQPTADAAKDEATEKTDVKSGFERLDPKKPGAQLAPETDNK